MAFDIEWTGRSFGNEDDHNRAIEAAKGYCAQQGIDPLEAWIAQLEAIEAGEPVPDAWSRIEYEAMKALTDGWVQAPDNFALVWN